ncbi:cytosine-purine permease [Fomes fomentarius]|nr:cytosine-purine permease [Fomes fomentarius]
MTSTELPLKAESISEISAHSQADPSRTQRWLQKTTAFFARWGIETNGIDPILPEDRQDTRIYQTFFTWFSLNTNIIFLGVGASGPAFFGLSLRDSVLIILVADLISSAIPAYFSVFGTKLGMRGMVLARYSWGYYGSIIPSVLNVVSYQGWLIVNCIVGGQILASVSENLDVTVGIVIIAIISLVVSVCGYRFIHCYETIAWIPSVVAFIVMLVIGGKNLRNIPPEQPASAAIILSYATTVAGSIVSGCTLTPDYGVYHSGERSSAIVFFYSYAGWLLSSLVSHIIGIVFAAAAPSVPQWETGFDNGNNVGGLVHAVLAPAGGFAKFLTVLLALFIPSVCAPMMYTLSSSFMAIHASFACVPRYVFTIISTAVLIPVAIVGSTRFYATFVSILNAVGYWTAVFAAIVMAEHLVFRKNDWTQYDLSQWCKPKGLPAGAAASFTMVCACGIIVPCMSQSWYVGPIASAGTGDIGVLVGFAAACIIYPALRAVERGVLGR